MAKHLYKRFRSLFQGGNLLFLALIIIAPLYLVNAFQHSAPMGYAGLFTQMANQIADSNFILPSVSPFYGPGGIPFAYPPFGLYLLAVLIKITGEYYIFLRLLPPILGIFSLIPLYFLSFEISGSHKAALASIVIAASSVEIYDAHAWAAGIVRSPAFFFSLSSVYFFLRQSQKRSMFQLTLAGVFLGLTFLSHLMYALFCTMWIIWWSILDKNFVKQIKKMLFVLLVGLIISSVWLIPVLQEHGITIFKNAFGSHGGEGVFFLGNKLNVFVRNLAPILSNKIIAILFVLGTTFLTVQKKITFISFFILILLVFPENARFVFTLTSIIAGAGLSATGKILANWHMPIRTNIFRTVLFIAIIAWLWQGSFVTFSKQSPHLVPAMFDLAEYIKKETHPKHKYLELLKQDEAEWLPFLLQREPSVGQWGSEWLGMYPQQTNITSHLGLCRKSQDWMCAEKIAQENNLVFDYLITYAYNTELNNQISSTSQWQCIYKNKRYAVWHRID